VFTVRQATTSLVYPLTGSATGGRDRVGVLVHRRDTVNRSARTGVRTDRHDDVRAAPSSAAPPTPVALGDHEH
jgi:hypothetical protein